MSASPRSNITDELYTNIAETLVQLYPLVVMLDDDGYNVSEVRRGIDTIMSTRSVELTRMKNWRQSQEKNNGRQEG